MCMRYVNVTVRSSLRSIHARQLLASEESMSSASASASARTDNRMTATESVSYRLIVGRTDLKRFSRLRVRACRSRWLVNCMVGRLTDYWLLTDQVSVGGSLRVSSVVICRLSLILQSRSFRRRLLRHSTPRRLGIRIQPQPGIIRYCSDDHARCLRMVTDRCKLVVNQRQLFWEQY